MKDMGNITTVEADDLHFEDAGLDSGSDCDSAEGVESKHFLLKGVLLLV
jgi:hypothetical protein